MSLRKPAMAALILIVGAAALAACGRAPNSSASGGTGKSYVINFTSPDSQGEPQADLITHFAQLIQQDSHGQLTVKAYFNGVLANSANGVKLVEDGSAQMTYANAPDMAAYLPAYGFLQEPLLFTNPAQIASGLASNAMNSLDAQLVAKTGIRVLGWGALGFIDILNSKHPIRSVADMAGLRIRVIPGSVPVTEAMTDMHSQGVPLDITEVYTALEQHTIDGNLDPVTTAYPSKQWQVAKFLTVMPFQYNPMPVLINNKFFESLPSSLQRIVQSDAAKSVAWEIADQSQQTTQDIKLMQQQGVQVTTISGASLAGFDAVVAPLRQQAYQQYGTALPAAFGIKP